MKCRMTELTIKSLVSFALMVSYSLSLYAEKMDLETHNLVIEKLESTLKAISADDQTVDSVGLKLQLANLYSEKARLILVEEGHQGCENCLKSKEFRQKAIGLYQSIQSKLNGSESEQVSLQLAHLLETTNKSKDALKIYNQLINNPKTSKKTLAQAYSKRAGNHFKEGQFDAALSDYQMVLKMASEQEKGTTLHKIAWTYYNQGEIDLAIAKLLLILKNEDLLKQPTADGFQYSEGFHSEVAHDLALFMAKDKIKPASLNQLIAVSPPEEVINNLLFLGDEAERIGQTEGAPLAWERALATEGFPEEKKLPVMISIARYHRDNFRYQNANSFYLQALQIAQKSFGNKIGTDKCDSYCNEQAKNLKQFLVQWEKLATKLTKAARVRESQVGLVQAYEIYHQFQNNDYETQLWLGQLSQKTKQFASARRAYARAADIIANSTQKETPTLRKLLDSSLLAEVELAESLNKPTERLESYEHYLKLNPKGPASASVRYQRAKLYYDQNKVDKAYALFDEIVSDNKYPNADLKLKSADLGLDALVLMKNVETLEKKSIEYGQVFPKERSHFHEISRKAGLEIVRNMATPTASVSEAEKALAKLETVTVFGADAKDSKAILRMKIDLALKAQKWESAQAYLTKFMTRADVNKEGRDWALAKKLAMAELLLDFKLAYQIVLKLNYANSPNPKELLKGALLAEINHLNAKPWLEKVIRSPRSSRDQVQLAKAQLIRSAPNSWKALHTHITSLKGHPNLVADLALECFSQRPDLNEARWTLSQRGVSSTWSGQTLQRSLNLNELQLKIRTLNKQRLITRTDALMASSLRQRIKSLAEIKNILRAAQRQQDWSLQVVSASYLRNENQRLAAEIELLPVPKRLSQAERKLYVNELIAQAAPFRQAASELDLFVGKSWEEDRYVPMLLQKIETSDRIRSVLMGELRNLAAVAPEAKVKAIQDKLSEFKKRPSLKEVAATQNELRKDPFDLELQDELMTMEKKLGNQSMVVFLQARSNSIKGGQL